MEIGSASSVSAGASNGLQVNLSNKARDQQEAVVATVLEGVSESPSPGSVSGDGRRLLAVA